MYFIFFKCKECKKKIFSSYTAVVELQGSFLKVTTLKRLKTAKQCMATMYEKYFELCARYISIVFIICHIILPLTKPKNMTRAKPIPSIASTVLKYLVFGASMDFPLW